MTGIKCIEFSRHGTRAVVINHGHPEYERLRARNYEAGIVNDRWHFERECVRTPIKMLLVQIVGAA